MQDRSGSGAGGRGLRVAVSEVWRRYGEVAAVAGVSLDVAAGEFVSLLGPSGSGKTTLLMMMAGFEQPDAGAIGIGGRDVTRVPPNKRNIAMVFQNYALFPHMTVADNIAFPLRMRGIGRASRDETIGRVLDMVKLAGYAARKPAELSGGQQQRVALARAIAFDPPVILMDEPLGALDKKLRQHMQIELKELQRRLGATVIYVTHDQEEAMAMSDRVAVIDHGQLMQLGAPRVLYDRPANAFVADFLGEMNFLPGRLEGRDDMGCMVATAEGRVRAGPAGALAVGAAVRVALRPEALRIAADLTDVGATLRGRLVRHVFNGASVTLLVELPQGTLLRASASARAVNPDPRPGDALALTWDPADAHVFAAASSDPAGRGQG